jgi:hypothetical protein
MTVPPTFDLLLAHTFLPYLFLKGVKGSRKLQGGSVFGSSEISGAGSTIKTTLTSLMVV